MMHKKAKLSCKSWSQFTLLRHTGTILLYYTRAFYRSHCYTTCNIRTFKSSHCHTTREPTIFHIVIPPPGSTVFHAVIPHQGLLYFTLLYHTRVYCISRCCTTPGSTVFHAVKPHQGLLYFTLLYHTRVYCISRCYTTPGSTGGGTTSISFPSTVASPPCCSSLQSPWLRSTCLTS